MKDKAMKNRNEKIEIDNFVFASKAQVKFYVYLKRCREKGLLKKFNDWFQLKKIKKTGKGEKR